MPEEPEFYLRIPLRHLGNTQGEAVFQRQTQKILEHLARTYSVEGWCVSDHDLKTNVQIVDAQGNVVAKPVPHA